MIEASVDSTQTDKLLDSLSDDGLKRGIIYKALSAGAKVLKGTAKSYFKNAVGGVADHYSPYIKAPFSEGIVMKGDKAYLEVRVSIMKDFRMKFFEKGTTPHRTTKKGFNRGGMVGKYFFRNASQASSGKVESAIEQSIDNSLRKL